MVGIFSALKSSDNIAISANDGVDVQTWIGNSGKAANNSLKFSVTCFGKAYNVPPIANVGAQYMTDKSNEYGGCANICGCVGTSKSSVFNIQFVYDNKLLCEICTPLGKPVVPDVKMM